MTNNILAVLVLTTVGCAASAPTERVYDFSARTLTGTVPVAGTTHSVKSQMRRVVDALQPELARCTAGTAGTLDVMLRIELFTDQGPALDGVEVEYPDARAAACAREVLGKTDLSAIETREPVVWVVHTPFVVTANP